MPRRLILASFPFLPAPHSSASLQIRSKIFCSLSSWQICIPLASPLPKYPATFTLSSPTWFGRIDLGLESKLYHSTHSSHECVLNPLRPKNAVVAVLLLYSSALGSKLFPQLVPKAYGTYLYESEKKKELPPPFILLLFSFPPHLIPLTLSRNSVDSHYSLSSRGNIVKTKYKR